jgi:vancomycin resistance protein VanW
MLLHTPLVVTERFHHGFDAFPDSGRTVPFGTGATLFYNYVDLQCHNPTDQTFQILVWVTDEHLKGEIRSERDTPERYHIIERDHRFLRRATDGKHFRANRIFRERRDTQTGRALGEEFLMENFCEMKYDPPTESEVVTI